jgi:hypothetical protein
MHVQRRLDALASLTELVADRRTEHHAGIGDVHRRPGVLQAASIDFDLRLGCPVSIRSADNRQLRRQHLQARTKQRGEARHVDDRIQAELNGLTKDVLGALHVRCQHLVGLAWVGRYQGSAVHDSVASAQRVSYRDAIGDVPDGEVRHVDAQFGDGGL